MVSKFKYYICDVFTDTRFGGNPLAVLPDARGLTDVQMQKIAREFNFSESTFVFPPENGHTRKVRIFTPTTEVPFAGHPNIGTAFTLATIGEIDLPKSKIQSRTQSEIVFEEKAGLVPITLQQDENRNLWCELTAPEQLSIGVEFSAQLIAKALSLSEEQIITTIHAPCVASVGLPFIIVELRDHAALNSAKTNVDILEEISASGTTPDIHIYTQSNDEFDIRSRMFAPLDGIPEDPATGSANCALAGLLAYYHPAETESLKWRIAQGVEMGRPSSLDARVEKSDNQITTISIGGSCVMVSDGEIYLD